MKLPSRLARAWQVLTWRHWSWAIAISVLIAVQMPFQTFDTNWYWAPWRVANDLPWYLAYGLVFLVAIAFVESSVPDPPGPPAWRYVGAIAVASVVCVGIACALSEWSRVAPKRVIAGQLLPDRKYASAGSEAKARRKTAINESATPIVHGWLAVFIYVGLRKSRRAARLLADAEMGRTEAQRNLLSAQLVAANARVDPAFVMKSLESIERAYEDDSACADALMDELIAFLRDAIPRLRSGAIARDPS